MSEIDPTKKPTKITLATMYGVGLVKYGPGTAGSFVAALLAWAILQCPYGWALLAAGTLLFTWLGTRSGSRYMIAHNTAHDPGEIIIDELAGQWLTYLVWYGAVATLNYWVQMRDGEVIWSLVFPGQSEMAVDWHFIACGFLLFRLFDILKPWPISWADRKIHGGWGVMFDDLLAAIPAGVLLAAALLFMPQYLDMPFTYCANHAPACE